MESYRAPMDHADRLNRIARRGFLTGLGAVGLPMRSKAATTPGGALFQGAIAQMIARGAAREAALRKRFPFGKSDGSSPYVLSARHGAFLDAKSDPTARAARIDEETIALRAEASRGALPPSFAIDQLLAAEQAALPSSGPVAEAMRRQIALLEALRPRAVDVAGIWQVPGGAEYYRLRMRCTTGSDWSPLEVDGRIGTAIATINARAERLLRSIGLDHGSVGSRLRMLKSRGPLYATDEAGKAAAVAGMNRALDRLRPVLPRWFNPPFAAHSSISRMTSVDEQAAMRGYRTPPSPGSPGRYFPDLSAVHERPSWTLTTVAYHETIPGHLLQMTRQARAAPSALQVRYAPGYSEGWAIYAEGLADRMGLLSPIEQLGFLQSWLFRLARVRADIGIHVHRWNRARAIHFLEETVGFELFFPFAVEVDRYCIEPAAFAGDALVALALCDAAPIRPDVAKGFHDLVLNHGPLSLDALATIAPTRMFRSAR